MWNACALGHLQDHALSTTHSTHADIMCNFLALLTEFAFGVAPRAGPSVSFVLVHLGVLSFLLSIFL